MSNAPFWIITRYQNDGDAGLGQTHTDEQIWNMAAFIRKDAGMTAAQQQAPGGKPEEDEDHMHAERWKSLRGR